MAGWAGFSDEELRRMQQKADQVVPGVSGRGRRNAPTNRSRQQLQMERALKTATRKHVSGSLPPEQRLEKPEDHASQVPPAPPEPQANKAVQETTQDDRETLILKTEPNTDSAPVLKELGKQEVELREKTRMELLQQEHHMMEEKNKRKKALLSKTLAEKSRQTQAEAVKLKRIQRGLQALDDMVSNDIGILRGRIEEASWDYSSARTRYNRAEAEFVKAKLDLHRKAELKEQLTEHLCAIIQENEQRKARKLEELMQQLELQPDEESLELDIQVERMLKEQEEVERLVPVPRACEEGKGAGPQAIEGGRHDDTGNPEESLASLAKKKDLHSEPAAIPVPTEPTAITVPTEPTAIPVPTEPTAIPVPTEPTAIPVPTEPAAIPVPTEPTAIAVPTEPVASEAPISIA